MRHNREIGCQIKKARLEKQMTIEDFSKRINLPIHECVAVELGIKILSYNKLEEIAKILNSSVSKLLTPLPNKEYLELMGFNKDKNIIDSILDYIDVYNNIKVQEGIQSSVQYNKNCFDEEDEIDEICYLPLG